MQHIEYKEGYVPEVNDANAASADRFAKDLDACLTQTTVLGAINFAIDPEDVAIGSSGSLPGDMQRMWCARGVDTYWASSTPSAIGTCTPWWATAASSCSTPSS